MTMHTTRLHFLLAFLLASSLGYSQTSNKIIEGELPGSSQAATADRALLNINDISLWVQNDGLIGRDSVNGWGLIYPRGTAGLVYSDNLIWVGKVQDGVAPDLRTDGGTYQSATQPGVILQTGIPQAPEDARVFRYRRDYQTADLRQDAAEVFHVESASVTDEMIEAVRNEYEEDLLNWPWQLGAPYKDINNNGVMDGDDYPDVEGSDQLVWFAYNDLDEDISQARFGNPSSGLEIQVTLWGYRDVPELENIVFKRYRIMYKGTSATPDNATIDSMYIGQWADADIGSAGDDLAGCDTLLSLGFTYNKGPDEEYKKYEWQTPGVGYLLLQGIVLPGNEDEEGIKNFRVQSGVHNLPMTSFFIELTGDAISEPGSGNYSFWHWNALRGFVPEPRDEASTRPWVTRDGTPTTFMASGDPITQTGWVMGQNEWWSTPNGGIGHSSWSSDYRMMSGIGPFTMALGDTQDVVFAIIAGMGADGRQSVGVIKYFAKRVRSIYPYLAEYAASVQPPPPEEVFVPDNYSLRQNYPNPFNPETNIVYWLPIDTEARLVVYNILGQEVRVLGNGYKPAGEYRVVWDGRDARGSQAPSGVYILHLEARHVQLTRRMVLLR